MMVVMMTTTTTITTDDGVDVDAVVPLQVIMNCVMVLTEILAEEGGMAVNQPIILHLLSKVNDFNEWGLITVRSFFVLTECTFLRSFDHPHFARRFHPV
jgi:hypothetical protein